MIDRPASQFNSREPNLLDALRAGARAITCGELFTHEEMIAEIERWKQSRSIAR